MTVLSNCISAVSGRVHHNISGELTSTLKYYWMRVRSWKRFQVSSRMASSQSFQRLTIQSSLVSSSCTLNKSKRSDLILRWCMLKAQSIREYQRSWWWTFPFSRMTAFIVLRWRWTRSSRVFGWVSPSSLPWHSFALGYGLSGFRMDSGSPGTTASSHTSYWSSWGSSSGLSCSTLELSYCCSQTISQASRTQEKFCILYWKPILDPISTLPTPWFSDW